MEKENLVQALQLNFNVVYYNDGGNYSFGFNVRPEESGMMLPYVISLIPGENVASLSANRGKIMLISESSLDTRETIHAFMYNTVGLEQSKLILEKGDK